MSDSERSEHVASGNAHRAEGYDAPCVLRSDHDALAVRLAEIERDAARYNAFFADGLPVCFRGVEYHDKASLDAAIDRARKD